MIMGRCCSRRGQITARMPPWPPHPDATPAVTVNKVCLSGLDAIALADH